VANRPQQTLADFRSTSCWSSFSYCWLIMLCLITIAVYVSDTFTAVQLLTHDDNKGFGAIAPAFPLKYSKWIFSGCIIASWALLIYEWIRALIVIRRGSHHPFASLE
jgi:hypothetical protein